MATAGQAEAEFQGYQVVRTGEGLESEDGSMPLKGSSGNVF
jgi:hypothetical protein